MLLRESLAALLMAIFLLSISYPAPYQTILPPVGAQTVTAVGSISPSTNALLMGSTGNVRINIPVPGIAVRIEVPREFLQGVVSGENDTHFITSNIRNDYYYYNVVDESAHWTYDWQDNASDGPCFKPNFSYYDPNAPYCVEIWNYLNSPALLQPSLALPAGFNPSKQTFNYSYQVGVDYCQSGNNDKYVFQCFTPPRFVLLHNLNAPRLAGLYNFTLYVASRTNILGYPDFVHAREITLFVPVSMSYNAGAIAGAVCDAGTASPGNNCSTSTGPVSGKGIVYAVSAVTGGIVARAYLNQTTSCQAVGVGCGAFKLTGLAPGRYTVEASAGVNFAPVNYGVAYSLTPYGYPTPIQVSVSANSVTVISNLAIRRAPMVCGSITYETAGGVPIDSLSGNPYLIAAGFNRILPTGEFSLNVTAEGTDPAGHVFRFVGVSTDTSTDSFELVTGSNVSYVGTDPYGTEFAGLPAPEDSGPGGYTITVKVWVSGYVQYGGFATVQVLQSPGQTTPSCSPVNQPTVSIIMHMGGIISGTLRFQNSPQNPESPHTAGTYICGFTGSCPSPLQDALFGGNIVIQAYDQTGLLRGLTVINGTRPDGSTAYASCDFMDTCASIRFYIVGFTEYYNHTLSGIWEEHDYGLPDGTYSLQVYVRGYELTSTGPAVITNGSNATVTVGMTRGGAFEVTVSSADNRFGTRAVQAMQQYRFLNSSIPVRARVYFYTSAGITVGYVDILIATGILNELGVEQFTAESFKVLFTGQNWSLREIWFYGDIPTHITNDTYTIRAYTLGYVRQFPNGIASSNSLLGFSQVFITLFIANEIDITVPLFSNPLSLTKTTEYDHSIGEVFSSGLSGAETANLTAGVPTLSFNIFGFGGMQLSNTTLCSTNVYLRGELPICGQGHFFYVSPDGTRYFDYGLDVGTYSGVVPEFGFTAHFILPTSSPTVKFSDLFLQNGFVVQAILMATVTQGLNSFVLGYCGGTCLANPPSTLAPLSWAQVQATNSTYSRSTSTLDGTYDGVEALFLPAGAYNITFSDQQYQPQTVKLTVGWGNSYAVTPSTPLCPSGTTCP